MSEQQRVTDPDYSTSLGVERRYDAEADRLFLVYYALPPTSNRNKWQVSPRSLDVNIKTAINKPVIIYPHNPNNRFHSNQAGNYVHPLPEEAEAEAGRHLTEEEYYNWQEGKGVVGRVVEVDKRDNGYAWTLEITDPTAKSILREDKYRTGMPGWTSPQILTWPNRFPEEERSGVFDHWVVSHVILTDNPAFGFEKSALAAKCLGDKPTCMIKTKSASTTQDLGFCVKQAITNLLDYHKGYTSAKPIALDAAFKVIDATFNGKNWTSASDTSSQSSPPSILVHNKMSDNQNVAATATSDGIVVTKTLSEQNQKQEGEQQAPPTGSGIGVEGDAKEREQTQKEEDSSQPSEAPIAKTLDEANGIIKRLMAESAAKDEMLKSSQKSMRSFEKRLEQIEGERRVYQLRNVIPRDLFRNEAEHNKEVDRIISKGLDKDLDFLKEHYAHMKKARMADEAMTKMPLAAQAKSAATVETDVADSYKAQDASTENLSSTIERQLSLGRKMFGGNN